MAAAGPGPAAAVGPPVADARPADGTPAVAWAVAVTAALLGTAGVVLQLASGLALTSGDLLFVVVDATVALVYGTVAALVLARRRHPVGWLVALAALGGGLAALGGGWGSWARTHPAAPALEPLALAYGLAWVPGTVALFTVVPWLVRDHPLGRAERLGLALGVASVLWFVVDSLRATEGAPDGAIVGVVVAGLLTAAATARRHRTGPVAERPGLGLLAVGTAVMALSFLPLVVVLPDPDLVLALPLSHLATQALFPVAILTSVLRNRLWGLDLAVSRAAVGGLLVLGLALVYGGLVVAATALLGDRPVAAVVAAVGVAVAVQPLHAASRRRVQALVYGQARTPGRAALDLGRRLAVGTGAAALDDLARTVGTALRLESVTLRAPDGTAGAWGVPTSAPLRRELRHGGRPVGVVEVTAPPGERLDARSTAALDQLLGVVAAGLALVAQARELERARTAATRARLAERQVVRRELHDGLGPWLSGLRLGLQGARNLLDTDPAAAATVLDALGAEADRRVEDVRTLSRSLLPPVLDELGLAAALEELVARHAATGFAVDLRCPPLVGLDARVAAAAYGIASEAVLNAARHSGAGGCRLVVDVDLDPAPGRAPDEERVPAAVPLLLLTCVDDGDGVLPGAAHGVGTRSMRERAEELGGWWTRGPAPGGGTVVRAVLPLEPAWGAIGRPPGEEQGDDATGVHA